MRFEVPQPHRRAEQGAGIGHRENPTPRPEDIERLRELLRAEAEALRAKNFPVDDECRIDPEAFRGTVYSDSAIERDHDAVKRMRQEFREDEGKVSEIGHILEDAVTVAFNKLWFDKRLIKVRTAEYDDYVNGIDELIIDTKTSQIIAAVDTTIIPESKGLKLKESINGSFSVRYGVSLESGAVNMGPLKDIPYAIITITPGGLARFLRELGEESPSPFIESLGRKILGQLAKEMGQFVDLADVRHKSVYRHARAIFSENKGGS